MTAMFEQRSAYKNLTRMDFIGAGQYDMPTIWKDEVKPEKFIGHYRKQK